MSKIVFGLVSALGASWALWAAADASVVAPWHTRGVTLRRETRLRISGGWFQMGSDAAEIERARALCAEASAEPCAASLFAAEQPAHRVYVRAFAIDRLEVSNADYQRCIDAGHCHPPRTQEGDSAPRPELPVTLVTFSEARDYCRFAGGDLPTEAQWEYAAHGTSMRSFPWGQAWNPQLGNFARPDAQAQPVDANPDGKSFFGLLNMAGNVWEFVLDHYRAPYDPSLPSVDPLATSARGSEHVLRGGSFRSPAYMLRTRYRAAIGEAEPRADVGLRCAYPAAAGTP